MSRYMKKFLVSNPFLVIILNSFYATDLFPYPLKTENLNICDGFSGCRKIPVAWNRVNGSLGRMSENSALHLDYFLKTNKQYKYWMKLVTSRSLRNHKFPIKWSKTSQFLCEGWIFKLVYIFCSKSRIGLFCFLK